MTRNRAAHCGLYECSNAIISGASKARRPFFCCTGEEAEAWGKAVNVSFSAYASTTRLKIT